MLLVSGGCADVRLPVGIAEGLAVAVEDEDARAGIESGRRSP